MLVFFIPRAETHSVTPIPLEADDYPILGEALKQFTRDHPLRLQIVRYTKLRERVPCLDQIDDSLQWKAATNDLRRQNFLTFVIGPQLSLPLQYELVDEFQQNFGVQKPPPGKNLLEHYQDEIAKLEQALREDFAQVRLSAPGISDDGQVAIVYLDVGFGGHFQVLRKKENAWAADPKPICNWVS